jgi:hypothetical protein
MARQQIKVLFILKKRSKYGVSYGLVNSCKFVADALASFGIESKIVEVVDNNFIDREVHQYKPTHVFIEAIWVVPDKFHVLLKLHPHIQWYVRIHSQTPFLGGEGIAFDWIIKYHALAKTYPNFHLAVNAAKLASDLKLALGYKTVYTPNIYLFDKKDFNFAWQDNNRLDIGCFGAIRPFKNMVNQAMAAIAFAKKYNLRLRFHINASRFESHGENILKNIKAIFAATPYELHEHEWMNHEDFIKLVRKMDLGLQVSYTETFNIVAADFVSNHIPIVGSKEIDWLFPWYQAEPNSVKDIVDKIDFAYHTKQFHLHRLNEFYLNKHNAEAIEAWLNLLGYYKRNLK